MARWFALFSLAVAAGAFGAPRPTLDEAVSLYYRARFADARVALQSIIADPTRAEEHEQARLHLAATLFAEKDRDKAAAQLTALLRSTPADLSIDPVAFPPDFVAFASEVRASLRAEPALVPSPAAPPAVAAVEVRSEVQAEAEGRPAAVWVPVGVGLAGTLIGTALLGFAADRHGRLVSGTGFVFDGARLRDEGKQFQIAGGVTLGVSLALLAVGVTLVLVMSR